MSQSAQAWTGDPVPCLVHGFGPCDCHLHAGCMPHPEAFRFIKTNCEVCEELLSSEDRVLERVMCSACRAVIKSLRAIVTE